MSLGSQRRELLGLITCRPRYISQSEIKILSLFYWDYHILSLTYSSHLYTNELKQIKKILTILYEVHIQFFLFVSDVRLF